MDVSLSSNPGIGCVLALQDVDPDCRIILALAPMQLHFLSDAVHAGVAELLYAPYSAKRVRNAILSAAA
jgi:response regulator of citrate/malate metabolism